LDYDEISGVGKLIQNETNMSEIAFSKFKCLIYQNFPAIKDHKPRQFGIIFLLGLNF